MLWPQNTYFCSTEKRRIPILITPDRHKHYVSLWFVLIIFGKICARSVLPIDLPKIVITRLRMTISLHSAMRVLKNPHGAVQQCWIDIKFGWAPQCGFSRTRTGEFNQIVKPAPNVFGGIWLDSPMRILENPHWGVQPNLISAKHCCTPPCGFLRTRVAECTEMVMRRRVVTIFGRSIGKTELPHIFQKKHLVS